MRILVMLSGGVESTALVHHGVKEGHEVECVHAVWDNKTQYEGNRAKAICRYYNVPYFETTILNQALNDKYPTQKRMDHPFWGAALLTSVPVGMYDEVWFGSYLGESPPGALAPAGAKMVLMAADCDTDVRSPLYLYKKKEQWGLLPKEVQDLTITCAKYYKLNMNCIKAKLTPLCQKCEECRKWKIVKDA
jgi:7-cyano-7-deazaguanine synthase in queuosine biosynthesis